MHTTDRDYETEEPIMATEQPYINSLENVNLLTAEDVVEILKVSPAKVYRMLQQKKIPSIRFGKSVRVLERDLITFINQSVQEAE
jgi:excisionase family DNA binding protein